MSISREQFALLLEQNKDQIQQLIQPQSQYLRLYVTAVKKAAQFIICIHKNTKLPELQFEILEGYEDFLRQQLLGSAKKEIKNDLKMQRYKVSQIKLQGYNLTGDYPIGNILEDRAHISCEIQDVEVQKQFKVKLEETTTKQTNNNSFNNNLKEHPVKKIKPNNPPHVNKKESSQPTIQVPPIPQQSNQSGNNPQTPKIAQTPKAMPKQKQTTTAVQLEEDSEEDRSQSFQKPQLKVNKNKKDSQQEIETPQLKQLIVNDKQQQSLGREKSLQKAITPISLHSRKGSDDDQELNVPLNQKSILGQLNTQKSQNQIKIAPSISEKNSQQQNQQQQQQQKQQQNQQAQQQNKAQQQQQNQQAQQQNKGQQQQQNQQSQQQNKGQQQQQNQQQQNQQAQQQNKGQQQNKNVKKKGEKLFLTQETDILSQQEDKSQSIPWNQQQQQQNQKKQPPTPTNVNAPSNQNKKLTTTEDSDQLEDSKTGQQSQKQQQGQNKNKSFSQVSAQVMNQTQNQAKKQPVAVTEDSDAESVVKQTVNKPVQPQPQQKVQNVSLNNNKKINYKPVQKERTDVSSSEEEQKPSTQKQDIKFQRKNQKKPTQQYCYDQNLFEGIE